MQLKSDQKIDIEFQFCEFNKQFSRILFNRVLWSAANWRMCFRDVRFKLESENMKHLMFKYFVLLIILLTTSCAQQNVPSMNVEELRQQMENDSTFVVLDVRTPPELTGPLGKIDGVINIPVQNLESRLSELDKYKNKEIAVICRTGRRSGIATQILNKNGFKSKNVLGGMVEYRNTEK